MDTILLIAALVSGALTIVFILAGLREIATKSSGRRRRDFLLALSFSLITAALTIAQLVSTAQQLSILR
ncbi:MAG TPA: hypothetical protein VGN32_09325 [Ktedonobacterales bacterium]|nr:hypothetical protein [Ktedonobacterales bacterium]